MSPVDEAEPRPHHHFPISLRLRHPALDPEQITEALGIAPKRCWKAGEPRRTPAGTPLAGTNRDSYWTASLAAGRWPLKLDEAICDVLKTLVRHRSFLHRVRSEGGKVELFVGWFFESQSGDSLTHQCLALAGDLQIDLSFDVYPADQPRHEWDDGGSASPE